MKGILQVLVIVLAPVLCAAEESKKEDEKEPLLAKEVFDVSTNEWYSKHFNAMKEPALSPLAKDKEAVVYRFTCLRTFDKPFAIKITKTKDGYLLVRKILSGKGGYEPGKLQFSGEMRLKPDALAAFEKLLADEKFQDWKDEEESGGLDGSQWIVEVVKNGNYKVVDRWSPREGTPTRRIGEAFLALAKWKPEELY